MSSQSESSAPDRSVILLVEDNQDIQTVLAFSLSHHGFQPLVSATGAEAMEHLKSVKPEIVLIDQGLPDITGIELGQRIRNHPHGRQGRLFLFSGDYNSDLARQATAAGFEDFLVKPLRMPELLEILTRML